MMINLLKTRSICILLLGGLFAIGLFSSCGSEGNAADRVKVFKYNQASGISSLDPAFAKDLANIWACKQLYSSLVELNSDLEVQPSIAKSWQISDDGLLYTFDLRKDVNFHNDPCFDGGTGRTVTAHDVVYSFSRIINPKTASPGLWIFQGKIAEEEPFVALDEHRFLLRLKKPFPPMLGILAMQYCSIIPREAVEHYQADFRANPVGTGPFQFKNWEEGIAMILLKHDNYFEQDGEGNALPYLDGVKISFIENKRTVFLEFLEGNIDFMSGLDPSYMNDLLEKDGSLKEDLKGQVRMQKSPYLNTEYLGITRQITDGTGSSLFQEKAFRQAINYAIDRNEMVAFLRNKIGIPAEAGFVPAGLPAFSKEEVPGYTFDQEKSRELLESIGYYELKEPEPIVLMTNSGYEDIGLFVVKKLEEVGVSAKIELTPPAFLRESMAKGTVAFFRGSWVADYPDAENYLALFYSKYGAPPNYTRFQNARYDSLYEATLLKNLPKERLKLYRAMDRILVEEAPVVPLFYDEMVRFTRLKVKGLEPNAINLLDLRKVQLD